MNVTDIGAAEASDSRFGQVEEALSRIPSVTAVRVVGGPGGRVSEVHLLAGRDRAPKQLVRDVQSVAMATFGLEVDYRTVSVVQLDDPLVETDRAGSGVTTTRPTLVRLTSEIAATSTEIRVHVLAHGEELTGIARGPASAGIGLVARAMVDAVSPLFVEAGLDMAHAEIVPGNGQPVALAVLRLATPRGDQVVSGSAVVRRDPNDAMARATLAALNRLFDSP